MKRYFLEEIIEATGAQCFGNKKKVFFSKVSIDSRKCAADEVFFAITGDKFDGHNFIRVALENGAGGAVFSDRNKVEGIIEKNPDVSLLEVKDTLSALQSLARYYRRKVNPLVIGITGSNGKSTTKEILSSVLGMNGEVLKNPGNFNNLVGLPLSILPVEEGCRYAVLEMGMSAAGEIKKLCDIAEPVVGIITNVGLSHSENFSGIEGIGMAKAEMASFIHENGGTLLYNGDDPVLEKIPQITAGKTVTFGTGKDCDVRMYDLETYENGSAFKFASGDINEEIHVGMPGIHNAYNCLAAIACALHLGMSSDEIKKGVSEARSLPGRTTLFELAGGICLVDDTYNANPLSFGRAIEYFATLKKSGRKVIVMGDMFELGKFSDESHRQIGRLSAEKGITILITVGTLSLAAAEEAVKSGMNKEMVFSFSGAEEAGRALVDMLSSGDSVLVKGSRGVHLETVVAMLKEKFGGANGDKE
ncbi:MAG: UDP-N-acetylmuramoyl-tripeptide--D-alanyl-D-alanine ligase [Candidatus Schekmanbacteria bacterium]|nr:UDP-N-acetylmuramoyl-tripeptide--D-alanyl-D-alanine ligase [Candidatus Schekmanbacteria bacterium]